MIDWGNFRDFFTTGIPSIVLYPSLIITAVLLIVGQIWKRINNKKTCALWIFFIEYAFIVVCSTIICRDTVFFEFDRLELTPFWTYSSVINHTPGVSVWDIVLNIVIFFPLGFLLKLLSPSLSLLKMLIIAVCCSVFIEINQYVFEKGVAQLDDIMHNTFGGIIGWFIARLLNKQAKYRSKHI